MKIFFQKNCRGITLIELMVALAIVGILMTGVFVAFVSQHRSYTVQDQVSTVQQGVRAGMDLMLQEIRQAGFNPRLSPVSGISPPWFGVLNAGPNNITISFDLDEDGIFDQGEIIAYYLADVDLDGDNDLIRQEVRAISTTTSNTPAQLVVENVVNTDVGINLFNYEILADGREVDFGGRPAAIWDGVDSEDDPDGFIDLDDPDGDMIETSDPENHLIPILGRSADGDLNEDGAVNNAADRQFFRDAIRNVTVTLVVRTEMEDPSYHGGLDINADPTDGTCRTRMLSARVRLRNLGLGLSPKMVFVNYVE